MGLKPVEVGGMSPRRSEAGSSPLRLRSGFGGALLGCDGGDYGLVAGLGVADVLGYALALFGGQYGKHGQDAAEGY